MGNVESGIQTAQAISQLDPSYVLMVGIAAAIKGRARLGDVIVCNQVIYYEQAKQTPKGPEIRPISLRADRILLQSAQNLDDKEWHSLVATDGHQDGEIGPPRVHFGPFAVGDKVVAHQAYVSDLTNLHPKLVGVEMESYGVAVAAASALSRPRFLAIRGVSDFADQQKDDDYRQYASAAAAAFTIGLIRRGLVSTKALLERPSSFIAVRHLSKQPIPSRTIGESLPSQFAGRSVRELLVDQTDLYTDGRLSDPLKAANRQVDIDYHIDNLLDSYGDAPIGYFGIAHIPLLFYSGCRLTNKRKLHFFELNRYTRRWEQLREEEEYPELRIDGLPVAMNNQRGDVLIRISLSNTVRQEEVAGIVSSPIASVHLRIEHPKRDMVVSIQQLHDYGVRFRHALDAIHEHLPNRERTHIFYAGPVSLAVYFGQLIIQTIDRRVVVYNYTARDFPRYSWGLEITAEAGASGFLVEVSE
jgi:nucleoside phosphorylase